MDASTFENRLAAGNLPSVELLSHLDDYIEKVGSHLGLVYGYMEYVSHTRVKEIKEVTPGFISRVVAHLSEADKDAQLITELALECISLGRIGILRALQEFLPGTSKIVKENYGFARSAATIRHIFFTCGIDLTGGSDAHPLAKALTPEVFRQLVAFGADVNGANPADDNQPVLHTLIYNRPYEIIVEAIKAGVIISAETVELIKVKIKEESVFLEMVKEADASEATKTNEQECITRIRETMSSSKALLRAWAFQRRRHALVARYRATCRMVV